MGVVVREKVKDSRVYWIFVCDGGRRRAKRIGDRKTAERVAGEIRERLAKREFRLAPRGPSFATVAEEWLARYPLLRSVSETTMENYGSFVRHHLIPFFGATPVADIDYEQIERFIAEKRGPNGSARFIGQPLSAPSLRVGLVALRLILDRAIKVHKALAVNPAVGVARFGRSGDEDNVDPFTGAELRAIVAAARAADPTFATFLRVWMQSGMRAGEALALQNQDVDLARGTALVRRTYSRGRLGPTKTRQSRVASFLHPVAEDTLEWRPGATAESRRVLSELKALPVRSLEPEAFVFGVSEPWSPAYVNDRWRKSLQAAKVRYREGEQLRHTLASTLLSRGANPLYVQKQGGWKSAAVLYRVYARWLEQGEQVAQGQPSTLTLQAPERLPAATPAQPPAVALAVTS
jgi:integrase